MEESDKTLKHAGGEIWKLEGRFFNEGASMACRLYQLLGFHVQAFLSGKFYGSRSEFYSYR